MDLKTFENSLDELTKSESEMLTDFITEANNMNEITSYSPGVEARPKDLKLDQIIQITQELSDGTVKKFKFKVIEIWPAPTNFFTVVSIVKPKDELNYWTLFYDNTWYIKKSNKSLINVHVKLI
jgi:hypothetical protein